MLAKGSVPVIIIPAVLSVLCGYLEWWLASYLLAGILALMLLFFRDPERRIGRGVVSAADGVVRRIYRKGDWLIISVFMNLHNVHVNRAPLAGRVIHVRKGGRGRRPAFTDSAGRNARATITLSTRLGEVRVVQITGVFAWRVCPYVRRGQKVKKGQRIGIIRFGSRVDVWLPAGRVRPVVEPGRKVLAGETTIAVMPEVENAMA